MATAEQRRGSQLGQLAAEQEGKADSAEPPSRFATLDLGVRKLGKAGTGQLDAEEVATWHSDMASVGNPGQGDDANTVGVPTAGFGYERGLFCSECSP